MLINILLIAKINIFAPRIIIKIYTMFAIVEIAGLQYKVEQDQKLYVNRLKGDKGNKVSFDKVLLTVNGSITVGAPAVEGIAVEAEIIDHVQADKVIVFKRKEEKVTKLKTVTDNN